LWRQLNAAPPVFSDLAGGKASQKSGAKDGGKAKADK